MSNETKDKEFIITKNEIIQTIIEYDKNLDVQRKTLLDTAKTSFSVRIRKELKARLKLDTQFYTQITFNDMPEMIELSKFGYGVDDMFADWLKELGFKFDEHECSINVEVDVKNARKTRLRPPLPLTGTITVGSLNGHNSVYHSGYWVHSNGSVSVEC
jgi:hypothetical protein